LQEAKSVYRREWAFVACTPNDETLIHVGHQTLAVYVTDLELSKKQLFILILRAVGTMRWSEP